MKRRQRKQIEEALPDFFTMLANAMKAGLSFPKALQMAGTEGPSPLREEFQGVLEKVRLGWSLEEALLQKEAALRIPDFSLMVHSVLVLRQIGGNFVPHFEKLSAVLREREKISSKIGLLTAQGMTQGVVVGLMPPALFLALFFLSPEFVAPLWETPPGWLAALLIAALDLGGFFWMLRLAKVDV